MSAFRNANATVAAHGAAVITPNDSTEMPITRSVFVGSGGDIKVTMADGQDVTFKNTNSGLVLPVQVIKVWSTGTTATDLLALY